jgi:polygalacturonase
MSNIKDFGATGDGKADDTEAFEHAIADGDGVIELPRGEYRITRTLLVDLAKHGRTSFCGSGGVAKLVMEGSGPAIFLKGTHASTADPGGFRPEEWLQERMPTVSGLEIEGAHAEADGVRIQGVMQPTLSGLLIRKVRTAVHVTNRARNLLIDHCHFYHNTGIGVHLDGVDLHQTIISDSHISYNRLGGIRIERSAIYNLQITGNDIEYNNNRAHMVPDADDLPTAEIYIDATEGSVKEGTICSNTIQATYSVGGANVRIIGKPDDGPAAGRSVGLWSISGNLIGSQTDNIHLTSVGGIAIAGNYIYNGRRRNLLIENCRNVVVGANCFGPRVAERCTGVRIVDSADCVLSGLLLQDGEVPAAGREPLEEGRLGQLELVRCRRMNLSGVQVLDSQPAGIYLEDCSETILTGCTVLDDRQPPQMTAGIHWTGEGRNNMISASRIGRGSEGDVVAPDHVRLNGNLLDA